VRSGLRRDGCPRRLMGRDVPGERMLCAPTTPSGFFPCVGVAMIRMVMTVVRMMMVTVVVW